MNNWLISGVARSGTTMLYSVVLQHMRNAGLDPRGIFEPYLWGEAVWHQTSDEIATGFASTDALHPFGICAHTETPLFAGEASGIHLDFLHRTLQPDSNFVAKIIRGSGRLGAYLKHNPSLKIVHLVRNPFDVVNSSVGLFSMFGDEFYPNDRRRFCEEATDYLDGVIAPEDLQTEAQWTAAWWLAQNVAALKSAQSYPDNIIVVPYEILSSATPATVKTVLNFLSDEPVFSVANLDLERSAGPVSRTINLLAGDVEALDPFLDAYLEMLDQSPLNSYSLDPDDVKAKLAEKYGGDLQAGSAERPENLRHGPLKVRNELRDLRNYVKRQKQDLREQLKTAGARRSKAEKEREVALGNLATASDEIGSLRQQLEETESQRAKARDELSVIQASLISLEEEKEALGGQFAKLESEHVAAKGELQDAKDGMASLATELATLNTDMDAAIAAHAAEIQSFLDTERDTKAFLTKLAKRRGLPKATLDLDAASAKTQSGPFSLVGPLEAIEDHFGSEVDRLTQKVEALEKAGEEKERVVEWLKRKNQTFADQIIALNAYVRRHSIALRKEDRIFLERVEALQSTTAFSLARKASSSFADNMDAIVSSGISVREMPDLTCVLTSYNNKRYLRAAVESVLAQSRPPKTILIADDCSSDGSQDLLRAMAKDHDSITLTLREQNVGPGLNRHLAFLSVETPLLTQLDGDDTLFPEKFEKELPLLSKTHNVVAYCNFILHSPNGIQNISTKGFNATGNKVERLDYILKRTGPLPHNMTYSKALYVEAGGYDVSAGMYEDWSLKLRLAEHARNWKHVDCQGLIYNQHGAGLSASTSELHWFWQLYCISSNFELLQARLGADTIFGAARSTSKFLMAPTDRQRFETYVDELRRRRDPLDQLRIGLKELSRSGYRGMTIPDVSDLLETFVAACENARSQIVAFERDLAQDRDHPAKYLAN